MQRPARSRPPWITMLPWMSAALIACGSPTEQPGDGDPSADATPSPMDASVDPPLDGAAPPRDTSVTPRDTGVAPSDTGVAPRDTGVTPPPSDAGAPSGNSALEDEILRIVNMHRAAGYNCGGTMFAPTHPLVMNEQLRLAARLHSQDMGERNYFAHNSPEGTTPFQRIAAAGYTGSPQGENIAAGNATASATMTQWMNSAGHCRNIMSPNFRSIGVGYANVAGSRYRHYWTQTFGGR